MTSLIGIFIVIGCVIGGYLMEHGNLSVLIQPAEWLIIFGSAFGALVISSPFTVVKGVIQGALGAILGKEEVKKSDYLDILLLLNDIFIKVRREGLIAVEQDIEEPQNSPIFNNYPNILKDRLLINFITDTLRTIMTTTMSPYELESLLDTEIEVTIEEETEPAHTLTTIADSLPGLGIVAAVLGVVLTMGKINEPPEVLGHSIGSALVGTFMGVLMCYGFVGPTARKMQAVVNSKKSLLIVVKSALVSFVGGSPPQIALEYARRAIPPHFRPSFRELEETIKSRK
ncbi:MAG: flagellar motor stator protein MotA [Thermosulfidibacteraceae bacterium]|mgnify:CR=1 FL=1|jgi:chemotaxis protein MotA